MKLKKADFYAWLKAQKCDAAAFHRWHFTSTSGCVLFQNKRSISAYEEQHDRPANTCRQPEQHADTKSLLTFRRGGPTARRKARARFVRPGGQRWQQTTLMTLRTFSVTHTCLSRAKGKWRDRFSVGEKLQEEQNELMAQIWTQLKQMCRNTAVRLSLLLHSNC